LQKNTALNYDFFTLAHALVIIIGEPQKSMHT